jgi:hypothetical protein
MMNFVKAILAGVAIFLGVQVGRDLAHKTMSATSTSAMNGRFQKRTGLPDGPLVTRGEVCGEPARFRNRPPMFHFSVT